MSSFRIELSPPEAVARFRDIALELLKRENGNLSLTLQQTLVAKAQKFDVHPLDREAVLAEVAALPAIQALHRLSKEAISQLAKQAREGDVAALDGLRQQAERGNAAAQFKLGWMYATGDGIPKDYSQAVKWYRLAAEQGNSDAQNSLGWMYANGRGVPQNIDEAGKWFRRSDNLHVKS